MNFNPDSALDLVAYLIVGIPAIIAAVAAYMKQRQELKSHRQVAEQMLYQVQNEHRSNLRDDIDDLALAVKEGFSSVRHEMNGLRDEIRTERMERIEGDRSERMSRIEGDRRLL